MGTNHSRVVPYVKFGMGYMEALVSAGGETGHEGAPTLVAGAGLRTYLSHHVGIDAGAMVMHNIGNNGGGTAIVPAVGFFFQSK
ncbi:MAG TPA: hypothetical protein VIX19_11665 [Terriglobales bacterium]